MGDSGIWSPCDLFSRDMVSLFDCLLLPALCRGRIAGGKDVTYQPHDLIRFRTPRSRELEGRIVLLTDDCALVKVEKPPLEILVDIAQIVSRVSVMEATEPSSSTS